jgi:hypothetical protein
MNKKKYAWKSKSKYHSLKKIRVFAEEKGRPSLNKIHF